ncbi:MAG: hypothetical protein HYT37_01385 [Candidatus Sungbacteria bacterium]|nr:hypothetical protein [Candidatus Sungbacteria bacterium]
MPYHVPMFSIYDNAQFSLKKRLWMQLAEKLVACTWKREPAPNTYSFFNGSGAFVARIQLLYVNNPNGSEYDTQFVTLLNEDNEILVREEFRHYPPDQHPCVEIFQIVFDKDTEKKGKVIQEARNLILTLASAKT